MAGGICKINHYSCICVFGNDGITVNIQIPDKQKRETKKTEKEEKKEESATVTEEQASIK